MKKKVLFLAHLPPPYHGSSQVGELIQSSKLINAELDATHTDISLEKAMGGIGHFSFTKLLRASALLVGLFFTLRRKKPDLVHFVFNPHGFAFYKDFLISELLRFMRAKTVIHLHTKGFSQYKQGAVRTRCFKRVFTKRSIIHLDPLLAIDVNAVRDRAMPLYFVANGIADSCIGRSKPPLSNVVKLLFLSNLMPSKGAHVLLEAINNIPPAYKKLFILKVVGATVDKEYTSALEAAAQLKYADNIEFTGPLYGEDKIEVMLESDILVLPTSNDCFPISILEAMSFSLAVVSTVEGAIPSMVVDGKTGSLFEVDDTKALTQILMVYLSNLKLLKSHQLSARERYEKCFSLVTFEKNLVKIIASELNSEHV